MHLPFKSINLADAARKITMPWSPLELARCNDHVILFAKFEGEYPKGFHTHEYDELFFVHSGEIIIQMKNHTDLVLKAGEMGVVPKGVEHCPKSNGESYVLMLEPSAPHS